VKLERYTSVLLERGVITWWLYGEMTLILCQLYPLWHKWYQCK